MIRQLNEAGPEEALAHIREAAHMLRAGGLVAFPTETVYGLGADATNGQAVARIFEAKGRPQINPLIVHVTGIEQAETLVAFSPLARKLAEAFWPGGLTLVLPRQAACPVSELASAGLSTLGVRAPAHPFARLLIEETALPLAAPSANRSGEPSPTRAVHVAESLGSELLILDDGPCADGLESTVVGFDGARAVLLRPGAIARDLIEAVTGEALAAGGRGGQPSSPGQMFRHYAPRARLRLNAAEARPGEVFLAFGLPPEGADVIALSLAADLREAAANLFAALREADARGARAIAVAPIPDEGLGEAMNDRLARAASAQEEP
jgi:L-threonylcarbamoyladenylate synthase